MASKFSDAKTKFQVGAVACAVATAAALTPVMAEAHPSVSAPLAPLSNLVSSDIALTPFVYNDVELANDGSSTDWGWVWIGQNRTPANGGPDYSDVVVFTPLSLIPSFLKPLYEALTGWINFQVCVFGVSLRLGPYGRTSITVGHGC